MRNRIKIVSLIFALIFLAGVVSSAPPFIQSQSTEGFNVIPLLQDTIPLNQDYEIDIHIINVSNGYPIYENVSCLMHLYNSKGEHTMEVVEDTSVNMDYMFSISKENFTTSGQYPIYFICNNSVLGGSFDSFLQVSPLAISQTTPQGIGSAIFLILMVTLMFTFGGVGLWLFKKETWWILGIFFVFFASLLLVYNTWLGYQYHRLFTGLPDSAMPERIFWILLFIVVLGLLATAALLFLRWKEVLRYIKKEMKKKEPKDEDLEDWDFDEWGGGDTWNPNKR